MSQIINRKDFTRIKDFGNKPRNLGPHSMLVLESGERDVVGDEPLEQGHVQVVRLPRPER